MRKLTYLVAFIFLGAFVACNQGSTDELESLDNGTINAKPGSDAKLIENYTGKIGECGETVYEFKAGRTGMDAGDVVVSYDETYLYVKITSTAGFQDVAENVKMWIGTNLNDLPTSNGTGAPINGQFPYKATVSGNTHVFQIALAEIDGGLDCDESFFIVVHGDVLVEYNGQTSAQTAYAGDKEGEGNRWWWYMEESVECCDDVKEYGFLNKNVTPFFTCFSSSDIKGWSNHYPYYFYLADGTSTYSIYKNTDNNCGVENDIKIGDIDASMLYKRTGNEEMNFHFRMDSDQYEYEVYVGWKNPVENGMLLGDIPFVSLDPDAMEFDYTTDPLDTWYGVDPRIADPSLSTDPVFYVIVKVLIP